MRMKEVIKEHKGVKYVSYPMLSDTGLVRHGFMTRVGGVSKDVFESLNLGFGRGDSDENVHENYARAAACFGLTESDIVLGQQTHTANIRRVYGSDRGKGTLKERDYKDVDGLITDERGIILATSHADCTPIFMLDKAHHAIAMVHSGWRGTVARISSNALREMQAEFGTEAGDVIAVIGPCICARCYEVGEEVAEAMRPVADDDQAFQRMAFYKGSGKYMLDLKEANRLILIKSGVKSENIVISDMCTFENRELFYSHRRMGAHRGQNMAFIALA